MTRPVEDDDDDDDDDDGVVETKHNADAVAVVGGDSAAISVAFIMNTSSRVLKKYRRHMDILYSSTNY